MPELMVVGVIRSELREPQAAPKQGVEGAPDVWIEVEPSAAPAIHGLTVGDHVIVITWLHLGRRDILQVHPRDDVRRPLTGVFATRSQVRPNPLGLHPVTIKAIEGTRIRVGPMEAIDGTPVVDIKPVI